jgi:hypothetical protein
MYILRYLFLSLVLCYFTAFSQISNDNAILYSPPQVNNETLQDFISLLNESTGKSWQLKPFEKVNGAGIYLQLLYIPEFKTKESFRLQSNGRDQLIITSSSPEGLVFGFYKHLRNLGFKFYLPDDLYTITPKLQHPFGAKKDIVDRPFLQIRDFFGTGGFGSSNSDPGKKVEKDWNCWRLRNGFGAAYQLSGHRGENFILENYDVLKKHPDWLASPLTGNKNKDQTIKLNYLNQAALQFFIDWTIQPFTQKNFILPPPNHTEFVSIEPSDGGGFLDESKAGFSVSDQVFGAANAAAKKLDELFPKNPNIGINLYAYSTHAAPPSFKLHPRVFVQLIPYQFQTIAFGPSFIKLWSSKVKRLGIYDYYKYADQQYDLPGGLTLDEVMKRLTNSVSNGSEGTNFETSYSKFATGIPLWVIGRYMSDGDSKWEDNLNQVAKDLYGKSGAKVLELFQLFYRVSNFGKQYLGNAVQLVKDALESTQDAIVQKRLTEIKQYLQYIHLVYQSRDISQGTLDQRLLPLATYSWKLYPEKIINSYRIMQLVSYAFLNSDHADKNYANYQKLHVDWFPETVPSKAAWGKITQSITNNEMETYFQKLLKLYQPTKLVSNQIPASILSLITASGLKPNLHLVIGGSQYNRGYIGIYSEKATSISIKYHIDGNVPKLIISTINKTYTNDTAITMTNSDGTLQLRLTAGETTLFLNVGNGCNYRIQADLKEGLYFFDGSPRGIMAFYTSFTAPYNQYTYNGDFYPSYIYIPQGINSVKYRVLQNALTITDPANNKITTQLDSRGSDGFEYRGFTVPPNYAGKLWKTEVSGNFNYNFQNIPDRYFLLLKQ